VFDALDLGLCQFDADVEGLVGEDVGLENQEVWVFVVRD
jgi:hypothetical protein